jgi:hypothetical protein
VDLAPDAKDWAFDYLGINASLKELEERKSHLKNKIVEWMGDNAVAAGGDVKVTLYNQAGGEVKFTRQPGRVLRVSAIET